MDPGSDGWRIVPEVAPTAGETVIAKRYLDSFADTPLRDTLDELGVGRLVICGAATDACIRATTMRALIECYDPTLVADSHTTDVGPWDLPLPDGRTVAVGPVDRRQLQQPSHAVPQGITYSVYRRLSRCELVDAVFSSI